MMEIVVTNIIVHQPLKRRQTAMLTTRAEVNNISTISRKYPIHILSNSRPYHHHGNLGTDINKNAKHPKSARPCSFRL